ncbi:hypothetical protein GMSM_25090 [Geomonas sp. Red276]
MEPRQPMNILRRMGRNLLGGVRLAFGVPTDLSYFSSAPADLVVIAWLDLLFNIAACFLLVGRRGLFAFSSIPSFLFHLPLFLFFSFWAARTTSRSSFITALPVAMVALSIPVELCHGAVEWLSQLPRFRYLEDYLDSPHYYRFFWWWCGASALFFLRLRSLSELRRLAVLLLFLVLVVPPLWYYPRPDLWVSASEGSESGELSLTEDVLAAQDHLLDEELDALVPVPRGTPALYFVGFAGDASQDVFLKEILATDRLFDQRFGTEGRSVVLANNPQTAASLPFATGVNLERTLERIGRLMDRDNDVLFLYLTSHGTQDHLLTVNNRPLELNDLSPERLRRALKKSGIRWKVVVVSACFSGGFIEPLKDDDSVIITAADATHESFGCGYGEDFTWFGKAYVDEALRKTFSFTNAFETARGTIHQWEEEQGETPSNPQMWVGKEIAPKLDALEKTFKTSPPATR